MLRAYTPFATAKTLSPEPLCPGIDAQAEHRPDVCRADLTSKTIPLPSIASRQPAKAHPLQQPVPFTVPTSSWRCTNSSRTSNPYSNDFPMQPNSLQLTKQPSPSTAYTGRPRTVTCFPNAKENVQHLVLQDPKFPDVRSVPSTDERNASISSA